MTNFFPERKSLFLRFVFCKKGVCVCVYVWLQTFLRNRFPRTVPGITAAKHWNFNESGNLNAETANLKENLSGSQIEVPQKQQRREKKGRHF